LSLQGCRVRMWDLPRFFPSLRPLQKDRAFNVTGVVADRATLDLVTDDLALACADAQVIFVVTQALAHAEIARGLAQELNPRFIPSLEEGDTMEFEERVREGFRLAMRSGIDLFYGLSSILLAIGEQFERGSSTSKFGLEMLHPVLLYRVAKGMIRSKLSKRPMQPRDLWKIKGIIAGGMDTAFYRDRIGHLWGTRPLEGYGGTELGGARFRSQGATP